MSERAWPSWWVMSGSMAKAFDDYERVKADLDDFDGDRRGIAHALARCEHELLKSIRYVEDPDDGSRDGWLIDGIVESVVADLRRFRKAKEVSP